MNPPSPNDDSFIDDAPTNEPTAPMGTTKDPAVLFRRIQTSRDKLFFIRHNPPTTFVPRWYLVQVQYATFDHVHAMATGKYLVRWQVRHINDSHSKLVRECRFWPEIHRLKPNQLLGTMINVAPHKAEAFLSRHHTAYAPFEMEVNLIYRAIVGPFNFQAPCPQNLNHTHTIDPVHWQLLKDRALQFHVPTQDIDTVQPLRASTLFTHIPTQHT
ncbi:hypothetical protein ACA910_017122 [Epithemia clementina (nom. ined.)]